MASEKLKPIEGIDYYWENGRLVFTEIYHLKRGYCCNGRCRHCPFKNKTNSSAIIILPEEKPKT